MSDDIIHCCDHCDAVCLESEDDSDWGGYFDEMSDDAFMFCPTCNALGKTWSTAE